MDNVDREFSGYVKGGAVIALRWVQVHLVTVESALNYVGFAQKVDKFDNFDGSTHTHTHRRARTRARCVRHRPYREMRRSLAFLSFRITSRRLDAPKWE